MKRVILAALVLFTALPSYADTDLLFVPAYVKSQTVRYELRREQNLYPQKAMDDEVEGSVEVICRLTKTGRVKACRCFNETPKGYGFCRATIKLMERDATVDWQSQRLEIGQLVTLDYS
jgi:protein TonB